MYQTIAIFITKKKGNTAKPSENETQLSIAWSSNYSAIYIPHFKVRYMHAR